MPPCVETVHFFLIDGFMEAQRADFAALPELRLLQSKVSA